MASSDTLIGTLLDGRYRVERELGSGGMADVLLAQDESLGRHVAIKVLHRRYARDESFVERFLLEANAAARLNHPNIVQVYDRGQAEGTYYIAMEYVDGRTLKDIIREQGPLGDAEVFAYSRQALQALRFAHRNGVVHRDIKPHNLMVDSQGTLKIADFGIARAGTATGLTEAGSIVGTAQYLSPEQAQGKTVSAASDLYSLGVVMFEMATGRVPFDGDQPVNVALQHVNDQPPLPSSINPTLNPRIAAIIMRAMQKDPALRYATAEEFIDDLEAAEAGEEPEAATTVLPAAAAAARDDVDATQVIDRYQATEIRPPRSGLDDDSDDARRRKWPWILLALVVLAAIALAVWALRGEEPAEQVVIPDLAGMTVDEARRALEADGLELGSVDQENSDQPVGTVIEQDPEAGDEIDEGAEVDIVTSAGEADIEVPDVVGLDRGAARSALEDAGFAVTEVESSSEDVAEGTVISQSPGAGEMAGAGSTVSLVVSSGSDTAEVPSVTGLSESEARSRLDEAGFSVNASTVDSPAAAGTVLEQSPGAGTALKLGETVSITVASGQNEVPPVEGSEPAAAQQALRDAGFEVTIVEQTTDDPTLPPEGVVDSQDPAAGKRADVGSRVTLVVIKDSGED